MTTLIFRAGENPTQCSQIPLGIRAENEVTQVALDFSPWAEEFGAGIVQLLVRRDGDSSPYPVVLTQSGTTATWTVSATDLAANGPLQAEFIYTVGTLVKKSEVLRFYVLRDIGAPGSAPDPYETWLETLTELAAQTQQDAADAEAAAQAIQDMGVQADTLEPGSYATVEKIVDPDTGAVTLVFGIPRGQDGSGGGDSLWEAGTGATAIVAKNPSNPNAASGAGAIAAGAGATASGLCSFAFGSSSQSFGPPEASGAASFAFGLASKASGNYSIAFGQVPEAKAVAALAFGDHVIASGRASLVAGRYNVEDENAVDASHGAGARKYLLIIGNGTADNARSNAMTVDWNGNEVLAGKLTLGAAPTEDMDAATKQYADRALPKAGGTMSGAIAMGSNKITGLANAENDGDAVNLGQVSGLISTNTAYFRGSFATKAALTAVAWQTSDPAAANYVTNNDYAVVLDDESQSDECWRYVYVAGTGWQAQYRINESPLTTAQLAALNSGATAQNISSIAEKYVKPSGGIPAADLAAGVIPTVPSAYASNPAALGTASPGSSTSWARGDHVHDFNSDFVTALLQLASKVAYVDDGGETYYAALESALTHRVLSSISADYTQSGTVLDTDSLDSLKSDLIVTAHYSDSSTAIVASSVYTLSGTLEAGTSTITVSYGGKTDTFSVIVTHSEVPAGYTMANYIENPNQTTSEPLVNTGVTPSTSGNLDVDIDFMMTSTAVWSSSDKYKYVIAINKGTGYSTVGACIGVAPDDYTVLAFNGASSTITPNGTSSVLNKRMRISATFSSTGSSITDGTLSDSQTGTGRDHGQPIYLFGLKTLPGGSVPLSYFMKARVYSCTVKDNNTAILNLIPCVRNSDNAAGFWDTVNENFITASGLVAG